MPSRDPIAIDYVTGKFAFNWGSRATWDGASYRGVLGTERQVDELMPRPVHLGLGAGGYKQIATTGRTAVWLFADIGNVVTTGRNANGERGIGTTADTSTDLPVGVNIGNGYTDASAGGNVPTTGGTLYALAPTLVRAWGQNADGQMGMGDTTQRPTPAVVWDAATFGASAVRVHAGGRHTAILDSAGRVWTAGNNAHGQLGRGTIGVNDTTWGQLSAPGGGLTYVGIACSHDSTLLLLSDGTVMGVGDGSSRQLGPTVFAASGSHTATPTVVDNLSSIVELMSEGRCSWFLDSSGRMYVYGDVGSTGLVGTTGSDYFTAANAAPRQVSIDWASPAGFPYTPAGTGLTIAHLGYASGTCDQRILVGGATRPAYAVIGSDGKVYVWSRNTHSQLGDNTTNVPLSEEIFLPVNGMTGVQQMTYGVASVFCGKASGTLKRLHFSPHHASDTKVLRQLSTDPADPFNFQGTGFNDSAWTAPVQITPDAGHPAQTVNNLGEPVWERAVEPATNLNVIFREWLTLPAETDALTDPGVIVREAQLASWGPVYLITGANRAGLVGGAGNDPWLNGTLRSDAAGSTFWAHFLNAGADNLFAWKQPQNRSIGAVTDDPTLWVQIDRIVSYISNVPPPAGGATRKRGWAAVIG